MGLLLRWAAVVAVMAATFNPTDWNYARWVFANGEAEMPLALFLGLLLALAWILLGREVVRLTGGFGALLMVAIIAAGGWVLVDWNILHPDTRDGRLWAGLAGLALLPALALWWPGRRGGNGRREARVRHDRDRYDDSGDVEV